MFIGAQVSLYPMTSDFVDVIKSGLTALTPYTDDVRIETDDMSTLMVGAPEPLLDAIRDLFAEAARRPEHVTMHVTLSRGCPGEPDDPSCHCEALVRAQDLSLEDRKALASEAVAAAPDLGVGIDVQFSLYVLGQDHHMDEIYGCIDFLKSSGCFAQSKNFCTKLRGDAGPVFETLSQAFTRFGAEAGHVALDVTLSANSPTRV